MTTYGVRPLRIRHWFIQGHLRFTVGFYQKVESAVVEARHHYAATRP